MSGIARAVSMLESVAGSSILPGRPADDALLELLVHMASQDRVFEESEIAMLQRVVPSWTDGRVRAYLGEVAGRPLDLERIAGALDAPDQAWTALRYAARMAARDDHMDPTERVFLDTLAEALALPRGAVDQVLHELTRREVRRMDPGALREAVGRYDWGAADFADGPVQSRDLVPYVPEGATGVMRVGVDQAEVLGLYDEGLVGRFLEGPSFLPWSEIVGCSRGSGLESSVRIHTEDGRVWSIVDTRLAGIQMLLDRLYRVEPTASSGNAPVILGPVVSPDTWDDANKP